jgi:hypothetical protein
MGFWDRKGFWEVSADDDSHISLNPNEVTEDYFRTGRHHYLVPNEEAVAISVERWVLMAITGLGPRSMVPSLERRCGTIPTGATRDA